MLGSRVPFSEHRPRGPSMQWLEPVFSSHKGLSVFIFPSSSAKEWECPRGAGPRATTLPCPPPPNPPSPTPARLPPNPAGPPSHQLRPRSRLGAKSLALAEPASPQFPAVRGSWEPLVAAPEESNFPLSRPQSCPPPWLRLQAVSLWFRA